MNEAAEPVPVSVIVLTRDEERNIGECLDSLAWAGDIVILDSHSTDRTVEIAEARGARVVERVFDDFSTHKNWALDHLELAHPWVLLVDADERATPALAAEIAATIARSDARNGYYLARQNWVWGKPLRCMFPDYNLRLLRRGKGRYENRIVQGDRTLHRSPQRLFELRGGRGLAPAAWLQCGGNQREKPVPTRPGRPPGAQAVCLPLSAGAAAVPVSLALCRQAGFS